MSSNSPRLACRFAPSRFIDPASARVHARVGISACLQGIRVRYDGADQLFPAIDVLATALELVPICPEVGAGLTVPRPPVRLLSSDNGLRAVGRDDPSLDVTALLQRHAEQSLPQWRDDLCGYLWKSRSPSCGLGSTPVFNRDGVQTARSDGIQAAHFRREMPWLPCVEETALDTPAAIDAFVLACRLFFDLRKHAKHELARVHAHYRFVWQRSALEVQKELSDYSEINAHENYLTAFMRACGRIQREELLQLFTTSAD